jgi:hypothetical protein
VFAAGEARAAGWGGLAALSGITGLARSTIGRGLKDLDAAPLPKGRERRKGGGRRHLSSRDATLIEDLRSVIEPATLGDPMRPLLWVSKSHDKVAIALQKKGHEISASSVKRLLPTLGYSRQSNRKADEGSKNPGSRLSHQPQGEGSDERSHQAISRQRTLAPPVDARPRRCRIERGGGEIGDRVARSHAGASPGCQRRRYPRGHRHRRHALHPAAEIGRRRIYFL